jgi:hypothetical protein
MHVTIRGIGASIQIEGSRTIGLSVGTQGPAGAAGDGGSGSYLAETSIPGHRLVRFNDDGNLVVATSDTEPAVALVRDAIDAGERGRIYKDAQVNGFSGLEPGKRYFLSATGAITKTAPSTGIIQSVGTAASPTILIVEIGEPAYQ